MTVPTSKTDARARVAELVRNFQLNEADYIRSTYNETQARTDFITPLLEGFGWDVRNTTNQPLSLRQVIEESTVEVGEEKLSKRPDYELRLARQRKLFVEAKKPNVSIENERAAAFQTRRYGYSANLPISILTNFRHIVIYDCFTAPLLSDDAHVARLRIYRYDEFDDNFDELWESFSKESVYSGDFDRRYSAPGFTRVGQQFDKYFLRQVRNWRELLAVDINANTPGLTPYELTYAVQLFLSRIVFLRICEDREIEDYESLKSLGTGNTFELLKELLQKADSFYDSGIFDLINDEQLGIQISNATLQTIIGELYYPQSPYTFSVVETEVLGEIYEQFLGEEISINGGNVEIALKPEVRESGGVVPTPRFIADTIIEYSLSPVVNGKSPDQLAEFTVADICCGSGIFLLSAYDYFMNYYLSWYLANERDTHVGKHIYEIGAGKWKLTFDEKRRILLDHVRGVDIDPNAVEVAKFSLLLKLIEDEDLNGLKAYVEQHSEPALPSLDQILKSGNSLVRRTEWIASGLALPNHLNDKINPLNWSEEFPVEMERGGFDVIVGNPPYIRIQNMTAYSPEEVTFYKTHASPYATARQDNFDKYPLFIERSLSLLRTEGRLGIIVPNKFMTIQSGRALRRIISEARYVENIINFGAQQVFGAGTSNYTCILVLDRCGSNNISVEQVRYLDSWRYGIQGVVSEISSDALTENSWKFMDSATRDLFELIRSQHTETLGSLAEIFVGLQTSADPVYIFQAVREASGTVVCHWRNQDWLIERDIVRPFLKDVTLSVYTKPSANSWIIFPYTQDANGRAHLIQPEEFADSFPGCWAYLNARRDDLAGRNVTGGIENERQWYQYGRSQSLTKFNSPKIILPALSVEPRYTYDDTNIMVTGGGNGPYYLVRSRNNLHVSNYFLLAVLCHPLSEALIRTSTSMFRGGYYSHGKQFIEDLPVPVVGAEEMEIIDQLVENLITINCATTNSRTPHERKLREREAVNLRVQIEEAMTEIFGLSALHLDLLHAVPIPR